MEEVNAENSVEKKYEVRRRQLDSVGVIRRGAGHRRRDLADCHLLRYTFV